MQHPEAHISPDSKAPDGREAASQTWADLRAAVIEAKATSLSLEELRKEAEAWLKEYEAAQSPAEKYNEAARWLTQLGERAHFEVTFTDLLLQQGKEKEHDRRIQLARIRSLFGRIRDLFLTLRPCFLRKRHRRLINETDFAHDHSLHCLQSIFLGLFSLLSPETDHLPNELF